MDFDNYSWMPVLCDIARTLNDENISYTVVGGASIALHGVSTPVNDIDIETNRLGAYRFQDIYSSYATQRIGLRQSESYRSYFGGYIIDGVKVEVMGDFFRMEGSDWVPTFTCTKTKIKLNGVPIVCSWLEEETLAYIRRGRMERAAQCLFHCDQSKLISLIRGDVHTNVL